MRRYILSLGIALALRAPAWSQPPPMPPERALTVSGRAEIQVAPDTVDVQLGVENQAPTAREAMERTNRAMQAVIERLRRAEVPERSLRTATLRLEPVYESPPNRPELRLVGYRAANILTVTLRDVTRAGPVLDAGLEAGANRLLGIQFRLANDLPARLEALKAATAEAQAKARAIAASLDVSLGSVENVTESADVVPIPRFEAMAARAMASSTPVQAGDITVHGQVTVRYQIVPKLNP
jgi:uncharacterized protein